MRCGAGMGVGRQIVREAHLLLQLRRSHHNDLACQIALTVDWPKLLGILLLKLVLAQRAEKVQVPRDEGGASRSG